MNTLKKEKDNKGDNRKSLVTPVPAVSLPAWALGPEVAEPPVAPQPIPAVAVAQPVPVPVPGDKCPAWEECEEPGEPCEICGSLEYWADLLGNRHCQQCHPPKLGMAQRLRYRAAKLRERKVASY